MYVRDVGGGPAVLLLHGTPSPADDWQQLADALTGRFRVLIPDLPGYGQSAALPDPSIERVGDVLAAMLAERGVTQLAMIAGYSTGVYRAFDLVLRHRIDADLVVALAGMAHFDDESRALRRELARRLRADAGYLTSDEVAHLMRDLMLSERRLRTHPDDGVRVARWPQLTTAAALANELDAFAVARDLRPELARLASPIYARVGGEDRGAPPAWSEDIARHAPRCELDIVPGCGHAILIEDGDATCAAIVRRLEALYG